MLSQYILRFSHFFFKRQKCLLPFTEVGREPPQSCIFSKNKAGLNFDIPRNNVPIVRKVTYLLRKGGKMRGVSSTPRNFLCNHPELRSENQT